jgi:hypothetical protein
MLGKKSDLRILGEHAGEEEHNLLLAMRRDFWGSKTLLTYEDSIQLVEQSTS